MSQVPPLPISNGRLVAMFLVLSATLVNAEPCDLHHSCSAQDYAVADSNFEPSPDFAEAIVPTDPRIATASAPLAPAMVIAPAATQPGGALSGRVIFTAGGHGWTYGNGGSGIARWYTQRGVTHEMNEDYGNMDQTTMFAYYCFNAGATVVPIRPIGHQTNEVVLDNDDAAVTFAGTWSTSSSTIFFGSAGDVPYKYASLAASETATATYTPNIPVAGFYPVYTWVRHGSDRTYQLYRINHTGGQSTVRIPHHMVGNGWVYLGTYYFNAGSDTAKGAVIISNLQPSPTVGNVIIADAIRFGNGMGDIVPTPNTTETTTKSGYPREEECARYWVQKGLGQGQSASIYNTSSDDGNDNVGTPPRMAREMNRSEEQNRYKRVFVGFHSNAGGGRGCVGLYNNESLFPGSSTSTNQQRFAYLVSAEVDSDMKTLPLEIAWQSRSSLAYARSDYAFGEIHGSSIGYEMDATIIEVAFHDEASDAKLLRDSKVRNWMARATYQGVLRYMNEFDAAPLTFLPEPPVNVRAIAATNGITVSWATPGSGGGTAASYVVYRSLDGYGFGNPVAVSGGATSLTITDLALDTDYYFRVAAVNAGGESLPSETVGCRRSLNNALPKVLFVNGFTRFDRFTNLRQTPNVTNWDDPDSTGTMERVIPRTVNSFDYVVQHGKAIAAAGMRFDSCHRDAISGNQVSLTNYSIVIWAAGQELTNVFSSTIQSRITTFLSGGGGLFVSGSEIAGNLDATVGPSAADRAFLNNQLHADLSSDSHTNAQSYSFTAASAAIFNGNSNGAFDDGSKGIYWVKSPSRLTPFGTGSQAAINYSGGLGGAAGIQYDGSAGGGKVVYFGFPFETITSATVRSQYMADIINFLAPTAPVINSQPQSLSVNAGASATFSVGAAGATPISYQWFFNGSTIAGATASSYTRSNVQAATTGNYFVVVTNPVGVVTSAVATLALNVAPSITAQPQDASVVQGSAASFTVTAAGTAPLSYQWRKAGVNLANGGNISGATSATLSLASANPTDAAAYSVVVTNAAGAITSSGATLTVIPAPTARTLNLPPRAANAPTGSEFIEIITPLSLTERENMIYAQIAQGNVPDFMRNLVAVTTNAVIGGTNFTVTFHVTPDYLAIGTDADYFLQPMTPILGQRLSRLLNCSMPTRKMVNNIWTAATVKLAPSTISPSAAMTTVPVFAQHNTTVRNQRNANGTPLGALVGGDKKDVVISRNIYTNLNVNIPKPVVIYGWHQLNGSAIQPLYNGHEETYADYSHGIRLVDTSITVNGSATTIAQILAHSTLSALLSDEGTILVPEYPLTPSAPKILTQPRSQAVVAGATATFTATVFGDNPLTYAWTRNGSPIGGATAATFSIANAQLSDAGSYTLVVSNSVGSTTSIPALLQVQAASDVVLFSDDFDVDTSSNWNLFHGSANGTPDYTADWAFNYGATRYTFNGTSYLIPAAPGSSNGTTRGIKLTVNNNDATGANAGVNIYPKNYTFGSNHVLKFDMWINYPGGAGGINSTGSTEHAIFGINHLGTQVNWAATTGSSSDGVWFGVTGEGGTSRDYRAYVGNPAGVPTELIGAASSGLAESNNASGIFPTIFPSTRFESAGSPGKNWVAVEVGQTNGNVFWKFNDNTIVNRGNTSAFSSGTIMLGLMDVFSSIANPAEDTFVIFDNVRVASAGGAALEAPAIASHPQNRVVTQGANATFSVTATGTAPLSYQWQFNGTNIGGATQSSFTRANAQTSHAGSYLVVVSNGVGSITSQAATLTVNVPPTITGQPQAQSVTQNSTASFSVTASGTAPLSYQWKYGAGNIAGATQSTYTLNNVQPASAGNYSVVISNVAGTVTSSVAVLTVNVPPTIVSDPESVTRSAGSSATFSVTANGTGPLSYRWKKGTVDLGDGPNVSGSSSPVLILSNLIQGDAGNYSVVVSNVAGTATSAVATLTIVSPPLLTVQPESRTANFGETVALMVTAVGPDLSYQWQRGGELLDEASNVSGVTTPILTLANVTQEDAAGYSVIVSNSAGTVTSHEAILSINDPVIVAQPASRTNSPATVATFSVTATGTAPLRFQWRRNGTNLFDAGDIFGTTTPTLAIAAASLAHAAEYSVVVANDEKSVVSSNAFLAIAGVPDPYLPSVTIVRPANNSRFATPATNFTGTARDLAPGSIVDVRYRLAPNLAYSSATLTTVNGVTTWTTPTLPLVPGTNRFSVFSIDAGGNQSAIFNSTFFYDVTNMLTVRINGKGQVKTLGFPSLIDNQQLPMLIGRPYLLTAFIGVGTNHVFTNWTNADFEEVSRTPAYSFIMQSNLVLQANFITNPFTAVAGLYNGLFYETNGVAHESSGFFTLSVAAKGSYSGKLSLDGDSVSFGGKFDLSGRSTTNISRAIKGKSNLYLNLELDWNTGSEQVRGRLSDGVWSAEMLADRATFNALNPATNFVGSYTFHVPRTNHPAEAPGGVGYGLVTNSLLGKASLISSGLGDGSVIGQNVLISKSGQWPLYVPLYKTVRVFTNLLKGTLVTNKTYYRGSLLGWVTFTNQAPTGKVSWIKKEGATTNGFYAGGFTNVVDLIGSPYNPPPFGTRMFSITNGTLTFSDGNLLAPSTWDLTWATNNVVKVTNASLLKPTFTLTARNGLLKGSFPHPVSGRMAPFAGAVLQRQKYAAGYFIGTNETGLFVIEPR